MSSRKLQTFDEYRYGPRSVLKPGDKFRVGGRMASLQMRLASTGCRRDCN